MQLRHIRSAVLACTLIGAGVTTASAQAFIPPPPLKAPTVAETVYDVCFIGGACSNTDTIVLYKRSNLWEGDNNGTTWGGTVTRKGRAAWFGCTWGCRESPELVTGGDYTMEESPGPEVLGEGVSDYRGWELFPIPAKYGSGYSIGGLGHELEFRFAESRYS